jgi:polyisoprenoid-binding protein YceI
MKNFLRHSLLLASLTVAPAFVLTTAAHAAETYTIDPTHTAVTWTINHFGFSNPWGKFSLITGTLVLDEQTPQNSKVSVTIPTANLVTGFDKLDEHLKSKDFFDVEKYPTATFESTKVTVTGKETATVEGTLTLHGMSKPETLSVTLNKIGENMMKRKTAGFSATATIKRSDFGISSYLPGLADDVKLYIESESNI